MGFNSELVVQGTRIKSTLERERSSSPQKSQTDDIPVNSGFSTSQINTKKRNEILKISNKSLDIGTDVITAVRSSDSEKNYGQYNSEKGLNDNKEHKREEKFKNRKQSDLVLL